MKTVDHGTEWFSLMSGRCQKNICRAYESPASAFACVTAVNANPTAFTEAFAAATPCKGAKGI
jgi:hypothetical protein